MKTTNLEGEFDKDQANIYQGISVWNLEEMIMAMNTLHQHPSHIQKSANFTVVMSQNREAQFDGTPMESLESNMHF